jgi:hypothetical protein
MDFNTNGHGHGHINKIVHDNVTIFDAKVHLDMPNTTVKRSFQIFVTKNVISSSKCQKNEFFVRKEQRISFKIASLQHKVDHIGWPIPKY